MEDVRELKVVFCPECKTELFPWRHKFCFECGKRVEEILPYIVQHEGKTTGAAAEAGTSKADPHASKVVVIAGYSENRKQKLIRTASPGRLDGKLSVSPQQVISGTLKESTTESYGATHQNGKRSDRGQSIQNMKTRPISYGPKTTGKNDIDSESTSFGERREKEKDEMVEETKERRKQDLQENDTNSKHGPDAPDSEVATESSCDGDKVTETENEGGEEKTALCEQVSPEGSGAVEIGSDSVINQYNLSRNKQNSTEEPPSEIYAEVICQTYRSISGQNDNATKNEVTASAEQLKDEVQPEADEHAVKSNQCSVTKKPEQDATGKEFSAFPERETLGDSCGSVLTVDVDENHQKMNEVYEVVEEPLKKRNEQEEENIKAGKKTDDELSKRIENLGDTEERQQQQLGGSGEHNNNESCEKEEDKTTTNAEGMGTEKALASGIAGKPTTAMVINKQPSSKNDVNIPNVVEPSQHCSTTGIHDSSQSARERDRAQTKQSSSEKNQRDKPRKNENSCNGGPTSAKSRSGTLLSISKGEDPLSTGDKSNPDDQMSGEPPGHFYKKEETDQVYLRGRPKRTRGSEKQSQYTNIGARQNNHENVMTITFHAILSKKFQRDDTTRVFIRGEFPIFRGWDENDVIMEPVRELNDNQVLLQGETTVPVMHVRKTVPYKYVVVTNGEVDFEILVEFTSSGIVNRCLVIPEKYCKENVTWDRYDGFIYPKSGMRERVSGFIFGSMEIDDRKTFFRECFPKWCGFYVNTCKNDMSPLVALDKLSNLVTSALYVWTLKEKNDYASRESPVKNDVPPRQLKLSEVIKDLLIPKIQDNLVKMSRSDVQAVAAAVVSSVVIVYVFFCYDVSLVGEELETVFRCLKLPSNKAVCDAFVKEMNKFDDDVLRIVCNSFVKLYSVPKLPKTLIGPWLTALPLFHFLCRSCKPYVELECVKPIKYENWEWWGLKNINVRDFRRWIVGREVIDQLPNLNDMFAVDRMLSRSFLLLSPIETYKELLETEHFALLELFVTLKKMLPDRDFKSYTKGFKNYLSELFCEVREKLSRTRFQSLRTKNFAENEVLLQTMVVVLDYLTQRLAFSEIGILCRLTECVIALITLQSNAIEYQNANDEMKEKELSECTVLFESPPHTLQNFLQKSFTIVRKFFLKYRPFSLQHYRYEVLNEELQVWNELLSVSAPDIFHQTWHSLWKERLQERISKVDSMNAIEIFCQSDEQTCHPEVANCLSDAAFKAVDEIVKPGQTGQRKAFEILTDKASQKCAELLSRMLRKSWPLKDGELKDDDVLLLKHLLTWPTWPGFLQFFGSHSNHKIILNDDCQVMMVRVESFIEDLIRSVRTAFITVAKLEILEKHRKQFVSLGEIYEKHYHNQKKLEKKNDVGGVSIGLSFNQRLKELEEFRLHREYIISFMGLCASFASVDEILRSLRASVDEDIRARPISDLCVRSSEGIVVVFFGLDPMIYTMASKIYDIRRSRIFNLVWQKYSQKLQGNTITLELILNSIWLPSHENLKLIKEQFLTGKMSLEQADKYLKLFSYNYDNFEREFELILVNFSEPLVRPELQKELLSERIKQVKNYRKLFHAGQAARTIILLKERMELSGDFYEVDSIAEIIQGKFSSQPINSVDQKLISAGKLLEEITEERVICLETFLKCSGLVCWLRKNIQDQQELKVFVDLAMISAGESDVEIDRISSMHTSCLGFASLIFGLKPEHGFRDLMRLCKPVWQAVDANVSLSEKLDYTNQHLSWLKQIKESHGSVALTTLMQVEAINTSSIYLIADPEFVKSRKRSEGDGTTGVCLQDIICLIVPADNQKKREEKLYSLEEVKDLQSKLMLIAGKAESGKEEVDQFVEVFEGVLRVGTLYVQLCEAGEINYLTWNTTFQCSKIGDKRETLIRRLNETCLKMEEHLVAWKEQIDISRKGCYFLNHFTMKQILKLRKELALACTGQVAVDRLPIQCFTLLESIHKNVDPFFLASVLDSAVSENVVFLTEKGLSENQSYFRKEIVEPSHIPEEEAITKIPEIRAGIVRRKNSVESFKSARNILEGMSFDEDVIVASLKACGRGASEKNLISWVVSGEYHDEEVQRLYQEALQDPNLSDLLGDFVDMNYYDFEDVDDKQEEYSTSKSLNITAETKSTSHSGQTYVNNVKDTYLSLPTLAFILEKLAHSESTFPARRFPSNFKEGEPNLLLVPKGEIFSCILSIFMGTGDQRLPSKEEVLVCDEKTTAEEIELLWRRAVVDRSGLLFCLANADLLDYDVSQEAVRALEKITLGESSYHIAVICTIENEDRSNMVASLDDFRRPFRPATQDVTIQAYLKRQMATYGRSKMIGDVPWQPAGTVDIESQSVRVVQSSRAGVGKSLVVKRLARKLENLPNNKRLRRDLASSFCNTIPVHGVSLDSDKVTRAFSNHAIKPDIPISRIFHLDISQSVTKGLDTFLFELLILRAIKDSSGNVWRRQPTDMYIIEVTTDQTFSDLAVGETLTLEKVYQDTRKRHATTKYSFLKFLPCIRCLTPRETLLNLQQGKKGDTEFDLEIFSSVEYQRTFQYLKMFNAGSNLDNFEFQYQHQRVVGDPVEALKIIIKYCGIPDPSWAELHNFVNFLNSQLRDCEESIFCNTQLVGDLLQGFRTFVVRFLIQMSRDFATRSLSDGTLGVDANERAGDEDDDLAPFQIRRRWERSPHPYIFFNQDHHSVTFLGFLLSANGDLLNPANRIVLERGLMGPTLRGQLKAQGVDFDKNYETWDRMTRITNLCRVMGIDVLYDPDSTYELTTDNVEKILAIHMRFRCGIPVIIMGETGCGKTRLIRFMCELQSGPDGQKNMLLMKVHGGTTYKDIEGKVEEAEKMAEINDKTGLDTVLFFDEANTTDAIDLIKEIMVDRRVSGRPINPKLNRLHFIAACNPYRKHTKEMIRKLESAGLGYHVSADETDDKLGSIPLRQLVYRVHPLPESMRPLVWDFGQLSDHTEELYTRQIVRRFLTATAPSVSTVQFPFVAGYQAVVKYGKNASQSCCALVMKPIKS